ncbi:unnamed protein product [Trichobilharzia regenti]|uniref:Transcription initiation factor IIA subunit 2 n=1 Tax=Trichobilharzia regenti TaxID=157069 RepID=A0A183VTL0_TRIRE|nr:unnamed protein product [Trichobilharzia regenti]CAH8839591.1 unnamed protein product [Trichobilharzia regenti]VDP99695.1 unnamed protein product [Trichobilharzia regenti]
MTYHEMYRSTTLGTTLREALDEMLAHHLLQPGMDSKVMKKFDQCISNALAKRVKNRLSLRGHLNTYRNCDNVWTLVMNDVEIKDSSAIMTVDKIKIVACEGKNAKPASSKLGTTSANDRLRTAGVSGEDSEQREAFGSGDEME